jgi:hypothetical protein
VHLRTVVVLLALAPPPRLPGPPERPFNGRNLDGWIWVSVCPGAKKDDVWSVADGAIHCAGTVYGYLRTEADYKNFLLTMKVRHLRHGNGGVLLRIVGPDKVWPKSVEAQGASGELGDVAVIDGFPLRADPARTHGRHIDRIHADAPERPLRQWNDLRITLDRGDLTVEVNGVVQNRATGIAVVPGKIGLQSEGTQYEFRDIEVRRLSD